LQSGLEIFAPVQFLRANAITLGNLHEIADELAFFTEPADHGQMTVLESVAQIGERFQLQVVVGTAAARDLLLIDPQGVVHVMEQAGSELRLA
jgi:hypothetical protein